MARIFSVSLALHEDESGVAVIGMSDEPQNPYERIFSDAAVAGCEIASAMFKEDGALEDIGKAVGSIASIYCASHRDMSKIDEVIDAIFSTARTAAHEAFTETLVNLRDKLCDVADEDSRAGLLEYIESLSSKV